LLNLLSLSSRNAFFQLLRYKYKRKRLRGPFIVSEGLLEPLIRFGARCISARFGFILVNLAKILTQHLTFLRDDDYKNAIVLFPPDEDSPSFVEKYVLWGEVWYPKREVPATGPAFLAVRSHKDQPWGRIL